jgi:hypothetical protein
MAKEKIGLGWLVKDIVTGFEGIVDHYAEYAHQGTTAGIQPTKLTEDGERLKQAMFDITQLEVLSKKPPFKIPKTNKPVFSNGDEVRCKFTGYQGKVGGRALYLNGCSRVYVMLPYIKEYEGDTKGEFIAEASLELVTPVKEKPKKKETRGGPTPDSFRY